MRLLTVVAGSSFAVAACAAPMPETSEATQATTHSIVGGSLSTSAQDATVLIVEAGTPSCTGVLVAPNLVLTARHCVSYYNESSECGAPLGGEVAPSLITVAVGVYASPQSLVARATRFFVPAAQDLCSDDIALVALDNDVKGVTPAKVRFGPLAVNEITTAIGYGQGSGRRQRTDVKVLALGPAAASYTTRNGQTLPMNLPPNEVATTESTCYGDSGGPLLDAQGHVAGVASRGLDELCVDRPTYWTSVAAHEQLLREAAAAVGHPLAEATAPPPRSGGTTNAATGSSGTTAEDDPEVGGDDDDTPNERARRNDRAVASAGCSSSARSAGGAAWIALAHVIAIALASFARRRRGSERFHSQR